MLNGDVTPSERDNVSFFTPHTWICTPSLRNTRASTKPSFSGSVLRRELRARNVLQQPTFYVGLTEIGQPSLFRQQHIPPRFAEGLFRWLKKTTEQAHHSKWSCGLVCQLGQAICTKRRQESSTAHRRWQDWVISQKKSLCYLSSPRGPILRVLLPVTSPFPASQAVQTALSDNPDHIAPGDGNCTQLPKVVWIQGLQCQTMNPHDSELAQGNKEDPEDPRVDLWPVRSPGCSRNFSFPLPWIHLCSHCQGSGLLQELLLLQVTPDMPLVPPVLTFSGDSEQNHSTENETYYI